MSKTHVGSHFATADAVRTMVVQLCPQDQKSDYPRTPQDPQEIPRHPRTLRDSIICTFNMLYERLVLIYSLFVFVGVN